MSYYKYDGWPETLSLLSTHSYISRQEFIARVAQLCCTPILVVGLTLAVGLNFSGKAYADWRHVESDLASFTANVATQALINDSEGRTWVGTQSGLLLFGKPPLDLLKGNPATVWRSDVVGIVETSAGSIIVLTHSQGLFTNFPDSLEFAQLNFQNPLDLSNARSMEIDRNDNVWVTTSTKIVVFNASRGFPYSPISALSEELNEISSNSASIDDSTSCLGGSQGIRCYAATDRDTLSSYLLLNSAEIECRGEITSLTYMHEDQALLAGTNLGSIISVHSKGLKLPTCDTPANLGDVTISDILRAGDGYLVSTDIGVFSLDSRLSEAKHLSMGQHRRVVGLSEDGHRIWALSESGIACIVQSPFVFWPSGSETASVEITSFAEDRSGGIYVGTYDDLHFYDPIADIYDLVRNPDGEPILRHERVMSLGVVNDSLLVGTRRNGMISYAIDGRSALSKESSHLKGMGITAISKLHQGALIGTYENGLHYYFNGRSSHIPPPPGPSRTHSPVTSITPLGQDEPVAVVTTERNVFLMCIDHHIYYCGELTLEHANPGVRFLSSAVDKNGTLWLGTLNRGLYTSARVATGVHDSIVQFERSLGGNVSVFSILVTNTNSLWIASNRGVWNLDPLSNSYRNYSELEGLGTIDFNHGASLASDRGRLYFGGPSGHISFGSNAIPNRTAKPKIYLRALTARDTEAGHSSTTLTTPTYTVLPNSASSISISLSMAELLNQAKTQFEYKLEGHSNTWTNAGNQSEVTFTNLAPGEYLFRARGADSSGVWSSNEVQVPIVVLPPWWQTWPAYSLYLFLSAALLLLFKRASEASALRRSRDQLELEVHLSQEREIDELQAHLEQTDQIAERMELQTNELLNCIDEFLTTDAEFVFAESPLPISPRAPQRLEALKLLQDFVDICHGEPTADLFSFTNELIQQFSRIEGAAWENVIAVNNIDDKPVPREHAIYCAVILRELLENAYAHAFGHRTDGDIVVIHLTRVDTHESELMGYRITVEDNGRGPVDEVQTEFEGGGLGLVYRIVQRLNGEMEVADVGGTRASASIFFKKISS